MNTVEKKQTVSKTSINTSELTGFPLLQKLLSLHTDKLRAIVHKEKKTNKEGVLRCVFTDKKENNVNLVYIPKKIYEEKMPDAKVTKYLKTFKHFETKFILAVVHGNKSIVLELPLGNAPSNVTI